MILSEKDIIDKGKFLIADHEAGGKAPSPWAAWHGEQAVVLTAMLDAYIRLNMLEQLSFRLTGKSVKELLATFGDMEVDQKKMFRMKYQDKAKRNGGAV